MQQAVIAHPRATFDVDKITNERPMPQTRVLVSPKRDRLEHVGEQKNNMIERVSCNDHKIKICSQSLVDARSAGCFWPSYRNQLDTKIGNVYCNH